MKTRALIHIDAWLGLPLCVAAWVLSLPRRLLARPPARRTRANRILVIKFLGMGSVLLSTPLLRRLRKAHPEARISFLTFAANAPLVRRLPGVDEVIVVQTGGLSALLRQVPTLLLRLRRRRFDVAVDLEFYSRLSNLVAWGSGARRRVGFFVRARWRGSLLTDPVYFNATLPIGEAVLALARPLGAEHAPPVEPPDAPSLGEYELRAAEARLLTLGVPERGAVVVVNVNASDLCDERRWPPERFARLVESFDERIARIDRFVFIGTAREAPVVQSVLSEIEPELLPSCLDLCGRTSLVELVVLLRRAALMVSNDSGPLHLAASLGRPTVSFYGPETPRLYGPVGERHLVFYAGHWCSPCLSVYNAKIAMCDGENECMRQIGLEQVVTGTARFCREVVGLAPPPTAAAQQRLQERESARRDAAPGREEPEP